MSKKEGDWKSLFGAWKDTDAGLVDFIRNSRLSNRDVLSLKEMKDILKYRKIKTLSQYNQYCDILEALIYKEDKSFKDEIELLEILIEDFDRNLAAKNQL